MNWLAMVQNPVSPSTQSGPLPKRRRRRCPTGARVVDGASGGTCRTMSSAARTGPSPKSIMTVRQGSTSAIKPPRTRPKGRRRRGPENDTPWPRPMRSSGVTVTMMARSFEKSDPWKAPVNARATKSPANEPARPVRPAASAPPSKPRTRIRRRPNRSPRRPDGICMSTYACVLVQESFDPADLFLVAGQRAPIPCVEKIQEGKRALRVPPLGVLQLAEKEGSELGSGRAVPRLNSLELGDRLTAGIAKRHVALGVGRVLTSQRFDEGPLALVVRTVAPGPLREHAGH